jgi:hypothetical protein
MDLALTNRTFSATFPTNTIQTFEIHNVYVAPIPPPLYIAKASPTGTELILSWPSWAADFRLVSATNLPDGSVWSAVTNQTHVSNSVVSVSIPAANAARRFFRLQYP